MLISMFRSGNFDLLNVLTYILSTLIIVFLVLPLHEWAHGFTAYKLGDRTAKATGRLTLNPLAHVDPLGSALLLLVGFGWAKPVPVNPRNFKNPKAGMAITALAGPVSNLLAAIVSGLLYYGLYTLLAVGCNISSLELMGIYGSNVWTYVLLLFRYLLIINVGLAVFNFIPIPPLDGSKILMAFLPDRAVQWLYAHEQMFAIGFFVLIMAGAFDGFLYGAQQFLASGISELTFLPFKGFFN